MSKKALIFFSGGKDSVLSYKKAQEDGYDVVVAYHYRLGNVDSTPNDVVVAIANAIGITNIISDEFTDEQVQTTLPTSLIIDRIRQIKQDHPEIDTLIVGADVAQLFVMLAFYIRLAHASGLSVYVPYMNRYAPDIFDDIEKYNLKLIVSMHTIQSAAQTTLNVGDVVPAEYLIDRFNASDTAGFSEMHTLAVDGSFFSQPVNVVVVNGSIQLQ